MTPIDIYKAKLEKFAITPFQIELLEASLSNLVDENNKLRFNNFACGVRELCRHVLLSLAPDEEVLACEWYENDTKIKGKLSRAERIRFAIHGGIDPFYVEDELIEVEDYVSKILTAITMLNKFTHVNESTFGVNEITVQLLSDQVIEAFSDFVGVIESCRQSLIKALEGHIDDAVVLHSVSDSLDSVDMLATHHSVDYTELISMNVTVIGSTSMKVEVEGNVHVVLQYGSNSDLRNDIGAELNDSFPFTCELEVQIDAAFPNGQIEVNNFYVDTSSWYGDDYYE